MLGTDVAAILKAAVTAGFSLLPVGVDKRPRIPTWKPYQQRLATRNELNRWWSENPPGWAVVTGRTSKIAVLDFDGEAGIATLRRLNLKPHVRTVPAALISI